MAHSPDKRRQFKPGLGRQATPMQFTFEEEARPFVPIVSGSQAQSNVDLPTCQLRPRLTLPVRPRAFVPQRLPPGENQAPRPEEVTTLCMQEAERSVYLSRESRSSSRRAGVLALGGTLLALVLLLATAFIINGVSSGVVLYQVDLQHYSQSVGGGGTVYPRRQLVLTVPVSGRVVEVMVKVGDTVAARQALLRLDPTQLAAQLKQLQDELGAATAYLKAVSAHGSATVIAQAQQRYELVKSKYDALVASSASPLLRAGELLSPMAGVVMALNVEAGDTFKADAALVTLADQSWVVVHARVPLVALGEIRVGQPAEVSPSAFPDLVLPGQVLTVVPHADPQSDTFEVWVEVSNASGRLLPGMSAFVRIQQHGMALVVPRLAVLDLDQAPAVFLVRHHHAYLRMVHVAARSPDRVFVDAGLGRGDQVVLTGLDRLRDGQWLQISSVER